MSKKKKRKQVEDLPVPEVPESPVPADTGDYASTDGMPVADDEDGE